MNVVMAHAQLLLQRCHALWDALIGFIALPRSDDEIRDLEACLLAQAKRCSTHRLSNQPADITLVHSLVEILQVTLLSALKDKSGGATQSILNRADTEHRSFGCKSGKWPQVPRQLLPYGPDTSLQAYVNWAADPSLPDSLLFITTVTIVIFPLVIDTLEADPILKRSLVRAITRALGNASTLQDWRDLRESGVRPLRDVRARIITERGAVDLLEMIDICRYSSSRAAYSLARGVEDILFPALGAYYLEQLAGDVPNDRLAVICHWLWVVYHTSSPRPDQRTLSPIIILILERLKKDFVQTETVTGLCLKALQEQTRNVQCAAANCSAKQMTLDGTIPFKRCERCRVTRYCSRQCQRADWRDGGTGGVSHKQLCAIIARARSLGVFDPSDPWLAPGFSSAFEEGGTLSMHQDALARWACGSGMLDPPELERLIALLRPSADTDETDD